jgi:thymidylate synthase
MKYNPVCKPNQLICGSGQIVIVTGWTRKAAIAHHLTPENYAVVGQLYSPTRGISFLIRNLLVNPHVHYLVAVNATKEDANAGAITCLLDFFKNGFEWGLTNLGHDCWKIKSEIVGYIDIQIEEASINLLRQSIASYEVKSIADAVSKTKSLINTIETAVAFSDGTAMKPWAEPKTFPIIEIKSTIFPGQRYGHRIEGKTITEAWVKILHRIRTTGTLRPTGYDGQWQELINLMAVITDEPTEFYFPEPNFLPIDRPFLEQYKPQMLDDTPYSEGVKYTYGQRMRSWFGGDQIEEVITKLINEVDAASAVINLWDSGGNLNRRPDGSSDHKHSGSPCLNHIWIRIVDDEISLTATLRSNDMFAAWPANAMGLRALQQHICDEICGRSGLNLKMGPLITLSQSAHIYDDTFENVDQLIEEQYAKSIKKQDYSDPAGNFLIEIAGSEIFVYRTTPGSGEMVTKFPYFGTNPLGCIRQICADSPAIERAHIGYLGIELEKARQCLNAGTVYIQDR